MKAQELETKSAGYYAYAAARGARFEHGERGVRTV